MNWVRITIEGLRIGAISRLLRQPRHHFGCRCLNFQCACEKCKLRQFAIWVVTSCFSPALLPSSGGPTDCNCISSMGSTGRGENKCESPEVEKSGAPILDRNCYDS